MTRTTGPRARSVADRARLSDPVAAAVIEAEGGSKPVCIAEPVSRLFGG